MAGCKRYWISVNSILKLFRALCTKTLSLATYHLLIFQNANKVLPLKKTDQKHIAHKNMSVANSVAADVDNKIFVYCLHDNSQNQN